MGRRPADHRQAMARIRRRWPWIIATLVLGLLIIADQRGWLLVRDADDLAAYHGRLAATTRVIDGDTLEVALPDALAKSATTRVGLWGVDCPELQHFDQPEQPWAREARDLAQRLIATSDVRLMLEPHQPRDSFGRVLAHVELLDGRCLNELLLVEGLAKADNRWPHLRMTRYAQVEWAARRAGRGVWSDASMRMITSTPSSE